MTSLSTWTQVCVTIFILVAFALLYSIPGAFCASYRLQHQGLLPVGKTVGDSLHPSIKSQAKKRKSSLSSSKNSPIPNANRIVFPEDDKDDLPMYKSELKGNTILSSPPASSYSSYEDSNDSGDKAKIVAYYDCPLFHNGNDKNGRAIIKADPFDCSCCYYCNWGIHYVQCCSWPLLWNDKIKSCDWYWKATCLTYDGWEDK